MTVYSHSRLKTFEQCPQRFKYHYIDKVETESEETVEAFLGSRVHEALEQLYRDLQHQKLSSLEEVLAYLRREWAEHWTPEVQIVRKEYTKENYLRMAEKYVTDYYRRYAPFAQSKTIALESPISIDLDGDGKYRLTGFIDRLAETSDGHYEIHDYKTGRLSAPQTLHSDRQLALYMIGVKSQYPDVRHVKLIWHFLAFDKEMDSTRTEAQLETLRNQTMKLIDKIESEERYPAQPGGLCDWCEFKSLCGQWSHLYKVNETPAKYGTDSGVQLVNKYAELKTKQKQKNAEWDTELEELEAALLAFAEKEKIDAVFGTKHKVRIKESERFVFPAKNTTEREQLEAILQKHRKYSEVSQLDTTALGRILTEKEWDTTLITAVRKYVDVEQKKRLYLSKMKEEDSAT